jgi:predicted PurR-regulated permease PerM
VALLLLLYLAKSIIVPLIFAIIIAILVHPVVRFLVRHKFNRVLAIIITLVFSIVAIAALGLLLFNQMSKFSDTLPELVNKFTLILNQSITALSGYLDIKPQVIHEWIQSARDDLLNTDTAVIGKTLVSVGGALIIALLIPVYIFLILFYEPIILEFIHQLFGANHKNKVNEIVSQTKTVIQRYLVGLVIEVGIITLLYVIALFSLGIDYAILLAILGALLNLIPYIGGIVGVALPMIVAIVTKDSAWYAIYVLVIYYFIQLVDNNYIVPKIVASKVKINALFSIVVVIIGNALWGISGMFLALPLLAIIKLMCDHIDPLKPWGFLLGDTMPSLLEIKPLIKIIAPKKKED